MVTPRLPFRARIARNLAELHGAELHPAVRAGAFELQLALEFEVFRLATLPEQVRRSCRWVGFRSHHDHAVFDVPQIGWSVPSFQRGAVEHLDPTCVIVEVES